MVSTPPRMASTVDRLDPVVTNSVTSLSVNGVTYVGRLKRSVASIRSPAAPMLSVAIRFTESSGLSLTKGFEAADWNVALSTCGSRSFDDTAT